MRAACLLNLPICVFLESDCTNIEQQKKRLRKEKKREMGNARIV